jgi:succinate dehydrogenase flavin-adding protein (antitoxin of CptAB toxin-antitoxin module)
MNFGYHFRKITNNSGQFVKYLTIEQDVNALRGQMLWRSKNLGVKELDLIVGSWALNFLKDLSYEQLV